MSDDSAISLNEETNYIGETVFYDDSGNLVESFNHPDKILVINFPGSGLNFKHKDESEIRETAAKTCSETKKLLPQDETSLNHAFVCTAVYENKADKAIKEYNDGINILHSKAIFEQILKPMIIADDYNKTRDNLSRIIFRGHCFGCMVISELENLLESSLKEQFDEVQCKELLSAPQALISSPALQTDKYPKHFQTTAIVNNSDRTITNEQYCGNKLKENLRALAGFQSNDLISLDARDIFDKKELPQVPDIKIAEVNKDNVNFVICNRAILPDSYNEMKTRIENRIGISNEGDKSYEKKYIKQLKKNIGGHEYFFLPDELKDKFSHYFNDAFDKMRIRQVRKKLHNSNIDPLAQLQENMTKKIDNPGKTGNSSTGAISNIHRQTANEQVAMAKQAILQRRQAKSM